MELAEYIIFGFCILGVGYTSYNIGLKEGIKLGASLMWEQLWHMGKPRGKNPLIRYTKMERDDPGRI